MSTRQSKIDLDGHYEVSTEELALKLGCTAEWVRQLGDKGALNIIRKTGRQRYFDLFESITTYITYIRDERTQDSLTDEQIKLADLKYKTARAGKMELELAEFKSQMHRAEDIEAVVGDMVARIRAAILSLPGRLAVDTAEASTAMETSAIIKKAVDDLLNELADYRYKKEDYKRLVAEREKWLTVKEQAEQAKTQSRTRKTSNTSKKPASKSKTSPKASKRLKT